MRITVTSWVVNFTALLLELLTWLRIHYTELGLKYLYLIRKEERRNVMEKFVVMALQ